MAHDILLAIIGGVVGGAGLFGLIQFLVAHFTESKEHKQDRTENVNKVKTEIMQHIKDVNDEQAAAIEELRDIVSKLADDAKERHVFNEAVGESLMALTHDKIIHLGRRYQKRGGITLSEQSNLKMLYEPYHKLGGNHDGDTWYNFCMEDLPVLTEEEAIKRDNSK